MRRYREEHPADVCFARGTFNSHPYVMGAMHEFLQRLESEPMQRALPRSRPRCGTAARRRLNERLRAAQLPVQVSNLSSIWTHRLPAAVAVQLDVPVLPARAGLALSWVGTGRLIFSLNYTDADFAAVADRIVSAAAAMRRDGWWWHDADLTNQAIRRRVLARTASGLVERTSSIGSIEARRAAGTAAHGNRA